MPTADQAVKYAPINRFDTQQFNIRCANTTHNQSGLTTNRSEGERQRGNIATVNDVADTNHLSLDITIILTQQSAIFGIRTDMEA